MNIFNVKLCSDRNMMDNDEVGLKSNRESLISLRGRRGEHDVMRRSSLLQDNNRPETIKPEGESTEFLDLLKSMLNPEIMTDPKFALLAVSNFFGFLGFYIPFVYLPSMAEDNAQLEPANSAFLLSIIGISNTLGKSPLTTHQLSLTLSNLQAGSWLAGSLISTGLILSLLSTSPWFSPPSASSLCPSSPNTSPSPSSPPCSGSS